MRVPERGEIWLVDLNPTRGREQANVRPILIITPKTFNALGTPIVAPITAGGNFARAAGFAVSLTGIGLKTDGVVLCHQLRVLDLQARQAKFFERVPDIILEEVLARIQPLFEM